MPEGELLREGRREVSPQCRHNAAKCRRQVSPRCRRMSRVVADVADVAECCRASSHFQQPKSPSNLIRRYALNSLEVVWSVAEVSQRCRKVSPMSRWCRSNVAIVSPDVAVVSPDVAAMSRWCRQMSLWCRGGVAGVA